MEFSHVGVAAWEIANGIDGILTSYYSMVDDAQEVIINNGKDAELIKNDLFKILYSTTDDYNARENMRVNGR